MRWLVCIAGLTLCLIYREKAELMPASRAAFTESVVEDATLDWFAELGYTVAHGPDLASGEVASERTTCGNVPRDTLLPKLLRRDMRVKEANATVGQLQFCS